ncbi:MAG: fasciclin domain-containing protein [Acidimicrobiia bacterium]|nr:fasciclin domain-containing protein [Acidimicrobiia bacterium]NNL26788.1 fasciclin domain-containing protein [Acidimicrobiia bacterium]
MTRSRKFLALLLTISLVAAACGASDETSDTTEAPVTTVAETMEEEPMAEEMADIVDTAVAAGSFTTLAAALDAAGLVDTLKSEGPFTVFAPTDAAFEKALVDLGMSAEELLASPDLGGILTYHVVSGKVMAADVLGLDGQSVSTVNGADIMIGVDGDAVTVNGIAVTATDIEASNGVIHVLDGVLLPDMMEGEAMEEEASQESLADIVDTAVAAGSFNTLATALETAGLVDTLKSEGPFTVFAPTDEAFTQALADLGISAEELLADPNLGGILTYHVVSGSVTAADVIGLDGQSVSTVNGADIMIEVDGDVVTINGIEVVTTDILTSNGVIHVLDGVLLP